MEWCEPHLIIERNNCMNQFAAMIIANIKGKMTLHLNFAVTYQFHQLPHFYLDFALTSATFLYCTNKLTLQNEPHTSTFSLNTQIIPTTLKYTVAI